jgi:hypothetical protein
MHDGDVGVVEQFFGIEEYRVVDLRDDAWDEPRGLGENVLAAIGDGIQPAPGVLWLPNDTSCPFCIRALA